MVYSCSGFVGLEMVGVVTLIVVVLNLVVLGFLAYGAKNNPSDFVLLMEIARMVSVSDPDESDVVLDKVLSMVTSRVADNG